MERAPELVAGRRPPALLPPTAARLGGFAALALLGALEWQRMVAGLSAGRATLWVLIATAAAVAMLWADGRPRWRARLTLGAVAAALIAAFAASGLDLGLLKPRRWDELAVGLGTGSEALASVRLPYRGADPWPSLTLQLLGALLCVLAALLAFWPRAQRVAPPGDGGGEGEGERGYRFLSLAVLLVLVATPAVSLGGTRPVVLGVLLTALTVGFLWLERLPIAPGAGIAAMLALALAGALPLASAADGDDPWFDYKAFAEQLGPDEPVRFDWGHSYGPISWPRDGSEVLRVATRRASYWKVSTLEDFDGATWLTDGRRRFGALPVETELAARWAERRAWREELDVTLRRIRTSDVIAAGTTLGVQEASRAVEPGDEAGRWEAETELRGGDSYTARVYTPRPTASQLARSTAGAGGLQSDDLSLTVPVETRTATAAAPDLGTSAERPSVPVEIQFPAFEAFGATERPVADYPTLTRSDHGGRALRHSRYARTWRLARALRRRSETPFAYVVAVNRFLQDGFSYNEVPAPVAPGVATLDGFLFDTRSGYCQHFSGAMAVLLRMGGIPARVVTGFSPGGFSERKQAWIVRDTDAHSWVEAWFDEWGWVTFDPTPAATPARSQIAAIERPPEEDGGGAGDAASSGSSDPVERGVRPEQRGGVDAAGGDVTAADAEGGGTPWWWYAAPALLVVALGTWLGLRWRRRSVGPVEALDRAVAELEAALRRSGRPAPPGTTLRQLEHHLGRSPEAAAYLQALRAGRYAPTAPLPTPAQRRALRRELRAGGGPAGWARALWALPPWR